MLVTVVENKWSYDLMYWKIEVIGGVQYEISEEQFRKIDKCDYLEVQSVIRNITLTSKKVWNIINR